MRQEQETTIGEEAQAFAAELETAQRYIAAAQERERTPVVVAVENGSQEARRAALEFTRTLSQIASKRTEAERAVAELQREVEKMRRQRYNAVAWRILRIGIWLTLILALRNHIAENFWILFLFGGGEVAADRASLDRIRRASDRLAKAGDPRAVGVLALALHNATEATRAELRYALLRLLPRVRASDAAFFTREQRQALRILLPQADAPLMLALLDALEQIGGREDIPAVESLHEHSSSRVRERVREVLPALRQRAARATESATLLRASSAVLPPTAPHELLRPATSGKDTPSGHLLRPSAANFSTADEP